MEDKYSRAERYTIERCMLDRMAGRYKNNRWKIYKIARRQMKNRQ